MIGLLIAGLFAVLLVYREHKLANAYRRLIRLHQAQPATQGETKWNITYKEGRATRNITVVAATESLALRALVDVHKARYTAILSVTKA